MRKSQKFLPLISAAALLGFAACGGSETTPVDVKPAKKFLDASYMDTTVKPGNDFFEYASGTWYKNTPIPSDQTTWGSFTLLDQENTAKLKTLLEEMSSKTGAAPNSTEQKLGDFFASAMDTVGIEKKGWEPLKPILDRIDAAPDVKALFNLSAELSPEGLGSMLGTYVGLDDKNSSQYAVVMFQAGTTLPEKSYYLGQDSSMAGIREAYKKYVAEMFGLTGVAPADADKIAADILQLETEIAKSHKSMVDLRDPIANYNKMSVADMVKLCPSLDWSTIHANMDIKVDSVIVGQPTYYKKLGELVKSTPLPLLKNKMKFAALNNAAPYLSSAFAQAHFNFNEKTLNGRKTQETRWKRMCGVVDGALPELLGQAYVAKYFSPDAKKRMLELVGNLQKAFENRINNLDWMSAETKARAKEKLSTIINKIGYPDKWKNYDDVIVKRDDFFANLRSANKHGWKEMVGKLKKPVDKTEWGMSPPTVNAYYNPGFNEIVFPAGILQFPFFDNDADDAINYGAIGAVIGHELTHGFDDQGSLYDAKGNLNSWWTPEDRKKFEERTGRLVAQYSSYPMLNGELQVNGALTLGENIADLGGVLMAYDAFKLTAQGKGNDLIDGFNPDQRFFLSYAQVWRFKATDEAVRTRIHTDPHSPGRWRVNGTLTNVPAFAKAFNLQPGDNLYRADTALVKIW